MNPRAIVTTIATIMVTCWVITPTLIGASQVNYWGLGLRIVLFALLYLLSVSLIQGRIFARWIAVALLIIFGVLIIYSGIIRISGDDVYGIHHIGRRTIIIGLTYLACGIALLIPYVGRHFAKVMTIAEQVDGGSRENR